MVTMVLVLARFLPPKERLTTRQSKTKKCGTAMMSYRARADPECIHLPPLSRLQHYQLVAQTPELNRIPARGPRLDHDRPRRVRKLRAFAAPLLAIVLAGEE